MAATALGRRVMDHEQPSHSAITPPRRSTTSPSGRQTRDKTPDPRVDPELDAIPEHSRCSSILKPHDDTPLPVPKAGSTPDVDAPITAHTPGSRTVQSANSRRSGPASYRREKAPGAAAVEATRPLSLPAEN